MNMRDMLTRADFSQDTDMKDRLRAKLFGPKTMYPIHCLLTDDDLTQVNAAGLPEMQYNTERYIEDKE